MTPLLRNEPRPLLVLAAAAIAMADSFAQAPSVALRPGDTLDWQGPSHTVSRVLEPQLNQFGCRGISVELISPSGAFEVVHWGSCDGDAPAVLRGPATHGGIEQNAVDAVNWGFDGGGEIVYHARLLTGGSSVWVGDTLSVMRGDAVPGTTNRFFTNPGAFGVLAGTGSTGPLFASSLMDASGNNRGAGLFQGTSANRLLRSGQSLIGLSAPLAAQLLPPVWFRRFVALSPNGAHWCASVELQGAGSALVVNGRAVMLQGLAVETGFPVPASVAPQATWTSIIDVSVDDHGRWTALLGYELASGQRERAIFRNGVALVEEGASFGTLNPITQFDRIHTSRNGRLAFLARAGGSQLHLIVDEQVALSVGDEVDYTGDGVVDPGFTVRRLGAFTAGTALDDDGTVWMNAHVETPSGTLEWVLLVVGGFELGTPFCSPAVANSTGVPARIGAAGHAVAGGLPLTLRATDLPTHSFGYFLGSQTTAHVPMAGGSMGTLCLGGNLGRFDAQIVNSGGGGSFQIDVDTTNIPGLPPSAVQPGETWTFQAWFRDANPSVTSNFTDAVQVVFS